MSKFLSYYHTITRSPWWLFHNVWILSRESVGVGSTTQNIISEYFLPHFENHWNFSVLSMAHLSHSLFQIFLFSDDCGEHFLAQLDNCGCFSILGHGCGLFNHLIWTHQSTQVGVVLHDTELGIRLQIFRSVINMLFLDSTCNCNLIPSIPYLLPDTCYLIVATW